MAALGFHERRHAQCHAAITSLSHQDGELLLALALTLQPSTRSRWAELASKLGLRGPAGRAWSTQDIEPVAERLAAASLVVVERSPSGAQHLVPPWIAILVLSVAVERGKLDGPVPARAPVHDYDLRRIREESGVELRIAAARRDRAAVARVIGSRYAYDRDELRVWLLAALGSSPPVGLIELLPEEEVRASYLAGVVDVQAARLHPPQDHVADHAIQLGDKHVLMQIARMLVLVGESERARALPHLPKHGAAGLALLAAFWAGDDEGARAIGDAA
ncbi:MAG: hypothetical protein IAG13_30055, partial [Deltaproteobacteria bacterium]|nr:hypothetical protein [Nannocystaceae bacterium]